MREPEKESLVECPILAMGKGIDPNFTHRKIELKKMRFSQNSIAVALIYIYMYVLGF